MNTGELVRRLGALPGAKIAEMDHARRGFDLDVSLTPDTLVAAVELMDQAGYFLETITGVDWLGEQETLRKEILAAREAKAKAAAKAAAEAAKAAEEAGGEAAAQAAAPPPAQEAPEETPEEDIPVREDDMEAVYDFNRFQARHRVTLRVRTPRSRPEIPTIQNIFPIAHWHERETHDFFGITFTGHDYLVPLLLPEDADYHPLRKDYGA